MPKVKVKDDRTSSFVKVELNVPRGLWKLLNLMAPMSGETAIEYLEKNVLAKEMECILGNLSSDMFDIKLVRTTFGEGSEV